MHHLLLLHGAIGSAGQLTSLATQLEKYFHVHNLDLPGHGSRPFPDDPYSIPLFAQDVLFYINDLKLSQVMIFGYSMGGYVGMYLAKHYSWRISGLVTLATKFRWDPAIAQRETQMINPDKILEKVPAFAQTLEQRHHPKDWKIVLQRTAGLLADLGDHPPLTRETYAAITTPVLLLLGDRDKMVGLEETLETYKALPNAQWGVLPGTPHPIEQVDIDLLTYLIRSFCKTNHLV